MSPKTTSTVNTDAPLTNFSHCHEGILKRLTALDELPALLGKERQLTALVSRDKRLLRLPLTVPAQASHWLLRVPKDRAADQWPAA